MTKQIIYTYWVLHFVNNKIYIILCRKQHSNMIYCNINYTNVDIMTI